MADQPLPTATDPDLARKALVAHLEAALEGFTYDYDGDRTIDVEMTGITGSGAPDKYLVRLGFLYYPDWPPTVTFLNPETKKYDGTNWPEAIGSQRLQFYSAYGDAPCGMVCNSMTFEYYFWGGHAAAESIRWKKGVHTFAGTLAELTDHLQPPHYKGKKK